MVLLVFGLKIENQCMDVHALLYQLSPIILACKWQIFLVALIKKQNAMINLDNVNVIIMLVYASGVVQSQWEVAHVLVYPIIL